MPRNRIVPYGRVLKKTARKLRKNATPAEIILWKRIRNKQILGYEFHRQVPVDNYIVDFYCHELSLAIEVDGSSHNDRMEEDKKRQDKLESLGVRFLRFTEWDVRKDTDSIVLAIHDWIQKAAL